MKKLLYLLTAVIFVFGSCKSKKNTTTTSSKTEEVTVIPSTLDVTEGLNLGNRAPEIKMKNPKDMLSPSRL